MIDFDEVVETSDAEELEEIAAQKAYLPRIRRSSELGTDNSTGTPRKKIKLSFHDENTTPLQPSQKQKLAWTDVLTPRKSHVSSPLATTSSPVQTQASVSLPRTPESLSISSNFKSEEDEIAMALDSVEPDYSQDPLLLCSPPKSPTVSQINSEYEPLSFPSTPLMTPQSEVGHSTTKESPPGTHPPSPVLDLFSFDIPLLALPPPNVTTTIPEPSSHNSTHNDSSLFTPVKPLSQLFSSSPLTPSNMQYEDSPMNDVTPEVQRSQSVSRSRSSSKSPSPEKMSTPSSPSPGTSHSNVEEDRRLAMDLAENDSAQTTRYSLRTRKLHQKMPFTADQLAYQRQLRGNPDAIVKPKALHDRHRHHHPDDHYEEEPDAQQDAEDAEWERKERRRQQREEQRKADIAQRSEEKERNYPHYPGLEEMSSTDEDERRDLAESANEARELLRKVERQRLAEERAERKRRKKEERAERERRKEDKQRKVKRFPMPKSPQFKSSKPVESPDESDEPSKARSEKSKGKQKAVENEFDEHEDNTSNALRSEQERAIQDYFEHGDFQVEEYNNDYPMQDADAHTVHENPPSSPPPNILRNSYDTAILVDSDEESDQQAELDPSPGTERSKSVQSGSIITIDLPSKKKQALSRMMPNLMINNLALQEAQKSKPQNLRESKKDNVPDGPLRPGQTRVQVTAKPKEIREIKGDSESELEPDTDSDESAHSDAEVSDNDQILGLYTLIPQFKKEDLINHAELELSDSVDVDLSTRRKAAKGAINNIRDPNGIQYMLARGKRTHKPHVSEGGLRNGQRSKFKLDVITNGARGQGTSKQTTLSFSTSSKGPKKPQSSHSGNKTSRPSGSKRAPLERDGDSGSDEVHFVEVPDKKAMKKQRRKAIRSHRKANGVYTIVRKDHIVTSGRSRETAFITLQLEEEDQFYDTFVPPKPNDVGLRKSKTPVQFPASPVDIAYSSQEIREDADDSTAKPDLEIPSDFRLSVLSVGRFFNPSTYIRKRWLFEAVNAFSESQEHLQSLEMLGFELDLGLGMINFSSTLPNICEAALEYATSLPDPDADRLNEQWSIFLHLVSQYINWYLKHGDEDAAKQFYHDTKKEIMKLMDSIQQLGLKHIETPVLIICRFIIDASLRLRDYSNINDSDSLGLLNASANLTVLTLLKVGFAGIVDDLINDADLDGSTTSRCAAELWVCLIHIMDKSAGQQGTAGTGTTKIHPFWDLLLNNLQDSVVNRPNKSCAMFSVSEDIWLAVFIICTLSRFSSTGMAVSHSHLPPCWDVVVFALGLVRLEDSLLGNEETEADRKRDKYIALLVVRCFQLHNTWKWGLGTAFKMLFKLGGIFKSRSYANLLHEGADYPEFFRQNNWDLLASYHENDSAYAVFLKLVHRAFNDQSCSTWLKKLESLAVPIGSLPFTKDRPPVGDRELAKLYNRFAATALLADLNRDVCADKVSRARKYVVFSTADKESRHAIICGVQNWACLLIERHMKVSVMADWIEELAKTLAAEQKELTAIQPETSKVKKKLKSVYNDIKCFLGSITNIYDAYRKHALYPEPFLLLRLKPILYVLKIVAHLHRIETSEVLESEDSNKNIDNIRLGDVLGNFSVRLFKSRKAALPPVQRPPLLIVAAAVEEDTQESQDYGDFGFDEIDWSDTANLPGALQPAVVDDKPDMEDLEKETCNALVATNFRWLAFEYLKPYLLMAEQDKRASDVDLWLHIFLACSYAEGDSDMWPKNIQLIDETIKHLQDKQWVRRIKMSVVYQILQIHPMSYLDPDIKQRTLESFLFAIVSDKNLNKRKVQFERGYVEYILSIDGLQHPLFVGIDDCLPATSRDGPENGYEFSSEEFLDMRIPILKTIFKNLKDFVVLQRQGRQDLASQTNSYIDACSEMFSAMRNIITKTINDTSSAKYQEYTDFCHHTISAIQEHEELFHTRLQFFHSGWRGFLGKPSWS